MMRVMLGASLLVAFYLLTSVATAYAERAWVLWRDLIMGRKGGSTEREWQLGVAVASIADCYDQMRQQIESGVKAGEKLISPDTLTSEAAEPPPSQPPPVFTSRGCASARLPASHPDARRDF